MAARGDTKQPAAASAATAGASSSSSAAGSALRAGTGRGLMAAANASAAAAAASSANVYERPGLSKDEIAELREAFDLFDTAGSGRIDTAELREAMRALGYDQRNRMVFAMIDSVKAQSVDFPAFLDLMTARVSADDSDDDLLKVFALFDDGTGHISLASLGRVAKDLGENMTTLELKEMIERADEDSDGVISQKEFLALMRLKHAE